PQSLDEFHRRDLEDPMTAAHELAEAPASEDPSIVRRTGTAHRRWLLARCFSATVLFSIGCSHLSPPSTEAKEHAAKAPEEEAKAKPDEPSQEQAAEADLALSDDEDRASTVKKEKQAAAPPSPKTEVPESSLYLGVESASGAAARGDVHRMGAPSRRR